MDARRARRACGALAALCLAAFAPLAAATPELPTTIRDAVSAPPAAAPASGPAPRVLRVVGAEIGRASCRERV